MSVINSLYNGFNHTIGDIAEMFCVKTRQGNKKEFNGKENFFEGLAKEFHNTVNAGFLNEVQFEKEKACLAYNIKATIYNVATVAMIMGLATAILTQTLPFNLAVIGGLGVRLFVDRAIQKTFTGSLLHLNNEMKPNPLCFFIKPLAY